MAIICCLTIPHESPCISIIIDNATGTDQLPVRRCGAKQPLPDMATRGLTREELRDGMCTWLNHFMVWLKLKLLETSFVGISSLRMIQISIHQQKWNPFATKCLMTKKDGLL